MKKSILTIMVLFLVTAVFALGGQESEKKAVSNDVKQEYVPSKEIQFIVPYAAGGNSDIPARIFGKYMSKYSAKEVKVVNIDGAGGRAGAEQVMKASPDGSTILMQPVAYPMQHALGIAKFTYEDFDMIGQWLDSSLAVVVNAKSAYKTMDDLVNAAKQKPNTVKMGSVTGTLPLFAAIQIELEKNISFNKVDLGQSSKATELLGNRIDSYIDGFGAVMQYIKSGEFRCLGIISDKKNEDFPSIPSFKELGFTNYSYLKQCFGLWAPKGTPVNAAEYINNLIRQAANDPDCIKELKAAGYAPSYLSIPDYTNFMNNTYEAFKEVAKKITG